MDELMIDLDVDFHLIRLKLKMSLKIKTHGGKKSFSWRLWDN